MEVEVIGSKDIWQYRPLQGIVETVKASFRGTESVEFVSMMLGGAHSKGLENEESDWDINLFYLPRAPNIVSLRRETFHLMPDKDMTQISEHPTIYDIGNEKVEITVSPVRTIGGKAGKEMWRNIAKCNMKVIHDFLKDYLIYNSLSGDTWDSKLKAFLLKDYVYSVKAVDGYFRGYMTSQLKAPGRMKDYDKREAKAYSENDIKPVVKAVVSGLYIGLSGLAFLEDGHVYRDFWMLYEQYQDLFARQEMEFIEQVYDYKRTRASIGEPVITWLGRSREFRESLYKHMVEYYDIARKESWIGVPTPAERRRNLDGLDNMLLSWLELI